MASRARYQGGDCHKISCKPNPSYPFEKGDLLWLDTDGMVRPANALTNNGTEGNNQLAFAERFVGVADEKYGLQTNNTGTEFSYHLNQMLSKSVSVCTSGQFEFPCPSQALPAAGTPVGIYSVSGSAIPDSQKVDVLASPSVLAQSIGYVSTTSGNIEGGLTATVNRFIVEIQGNKPMSTTPVAGTYSGTSGQ